MKTVVCPKCGSRIGITRGATAVHWSCPNKKQRENPPIYVEVTE